MEKYRNVGKPFKMVSSVALMLRREFTLPIKPSLF